MLLAGMGADLFESYCGSLLAACALGAAAFAGDEVLQGRAVTAPFLIAALGILVSIAGVFLVRTGEEADQGALLAALSRGINASAVLLLLLSLPALHWLAMPNLWGTWGAVAVGLLTGVVVGRATEYATSPTYAATRAIARAAESGPATTIIAGIGSGMHGVDLCCCNGAGVRFLLRFRNVERMHGVDAAVVDVPLPDGGSRRVCIPAQGR